MGRFFYVCIIEIENCNTMIVANNPENKTWIEVPKNSDFPIQNIPFGIATPKSTKDGRVVSRIGDMIIDLSQLGELGYFNSLNMDISVFYEDKLNPFIELGKEVSRAVRDKISDLFKKGNTEITEEHKKAIILNINDLEMLLPVQIGDYTDFYSSEQHAYNVGCMFRDPNNALLPNWKHLPVGYHGRASSIKVSGTPFHRPKGQQKPNDDEPPVFGPCKLLDFELEMTFVIGKSTELGDSVSIDIAEDYIFGVALFNDWSARDIQKWEYVPLGPFLAKNFATHVSPWIVTLDALEPFKVAGDKQDPKVLPYLEFEGDKNYDIDLDVFIQPEGGEENKVSTSNFKYMYWNMCQQLAHHTVNGCDINVGDFMASGTISGPNEGQYGSMLEISWKGTKPFPMSDGTERKFIQDGDTVIMRGHGKKDGVRIGFGEVSAKILPAK